MSKRPVARGTAAGARAPRAAPLEPLRLAYHLVIGAAIGIVSLFTGLAWPFAILTGIVIGKANSDRRLGYRESASVTELLAASGGVVGMLFFGVVIGGLVAFAVVALAAFSERLAETSSATDQLLARIVIALVGGVVWLVGWLAFGFTISLSFGS